MAPLGGSNSSSSSCCCSCRWLRVCACVCVDKSAASLNVECFNCLPLGWVSNGSSSIRRSRRRSSRGCRIGAERKRTFWQVVASGKWQAASGKSKSQLMAPCSTSFYRSSASTAWPKLSQQTCVHTDSERERERGSEGGRGDRCMPRTHVHR